MFRTLAKFLRNPVARLEALEELLELERARLRVALSMERARLLEQARRETPLNPVLQGAKVYSQTDEDGIIAEIFRRIGTGNRIFLELGCGNGLENNTANLLLCGFSGVWIDASEKNVRRIEAGLAPVDPRKLVVRHAFVTQENVEQVASEALQTLAGAVPPSIDFLSVDIDGNDLAVFRALTCSRSRVVCVEYNPKFPLPMKVALPEDPGHRWADDDYHGASLAAWLDPMRERGYRLICCTLAGSNAFFVREDLAQPLGYYPPELLWQPARFDLSQLTSGHRPSFGFLRDAVSLRR